MAPKAVLDTFANMAIISVVESAANTLTFKKLETGISLTEKVAWVISRIEYFPDEMLASLYNSDGDTIAFGIAVSNSWAAPASTETTILDLNYQTRADFGVAASSYRQARPILKDFSSMPSGGLLVPPTPLYGWLKGTGLNSASGLTIRIYYTLMQLAVDQYWELVEARRVISS